MNERLPFPLEGPVEARIPDLENDRFIAVLAGLFPWLNPGFVVRTNAFLPQPLYQIPVEDEVPDFPREQHMWLTHDVLVGTFKELSDALVAQLRRSLQTLLRVQILPDGTVEPERQRDGTINEEQVEAAWNANEEYQEWLKSLGVGAPDENQLSPVARDCRDPEVIARELKRREELARRGIPVSKVDPAWATFFHAMFHGIQERGGWEGHAQFVEQLKLHLAYFEELSAWELAQSAKIQADLASKHTGPVVE